MRSGCVAFTGLVGWRYIECRVRAERIGFRGYGMMLGEVGLPPGADVDRESLEHVLQGNYSLYRYDVLPDRGDFVHLAGGGWFELQLQIPPTICNDSRDCAVSSLRLLQP